MAFDYSQLYNDSYELDNSWRLVFNSTQPLGNELVGLLKKVIFLPQDFYDIVAVYYLLPSALCRTIPYLFLCGQSGSGKSILADAARYLYNVNTSSSSDSFAGIRNTLDDRRKGYAELPYEDGSDLTYRKPVEKNTIMVWDDIDPSVFFKYPDLYRLFKFGYDRRSSKITISGKEVGEVLEFNCFCPKVFSSISHFHLDDRFKELKRRLIVIPLKRVEELSDELLAEYSVTKENYATNLVSLDDYDWKGFSDLYRDFWDYNRAEDFLEARKELSRTAKGLTSQTRAISLDMMACGIATGIWFDAEEAVSRMKVYWDWFRSETEKTAGLSQLLKEYVKAEKKNAKNGGVQLTISTTEIRQQIENWYLDGWILDKPNTNSLKSLLLEQGLRLHKGYWREN